MALEPRVTRKSLQSSRRTLIFDPVETPFITDNTHTLKGCILRDLKLTRPIFRKTAAHGHFGRADPDFLWEVPKKLEL